MYTFTRVYVCYIPHQPSAITQTNLNKSDRYLIIGVCGAQQMQK